MFYALPAETVFEAKQRTRRATVYLFLMLTFFYVAFFNLLLITFCLCFNYRGFIKIFPAIPTVAYIATGLAVVLAVFHFLSVRAKTLDEMMAELGTTDPDPKDQYHAQFVNIVSELEGATGIHPIRPVLLTSAGSNAFSLQDGKGNCAIGATEGLLSRLTRPELSSVLAHEAAHLVHEDSRLISTAIFLFSVFEKFNSALGGLLSNSGRRTSSRGGVSLPAGNFQASILIVMLWFVSGVGYVVTRLIFTVISREREYYADADGVAMCKDPLALAESLYKISNRYRGDLPQTYGALFILNPTDSSLDEGEGFTSQLFSNHPPVSKRLSKLLAWAKSDLKTVQDMAQKEDQQTREGLTGGPVADGGAAFMVNQGNNWTGPFSPLQLLAMGSVTPSTWVCPAGSQQVTRASDMGELLPLFLKQVQGAVSQGACPRCKVPLVMITYKGVQVEQCSFCKGHLLRSGVLERFIAREDGKFDPGDVERAKAWRARQGGPLKNRDLFPAIKCPHCGGPMGKCVHSYMTQVVIDRCSDYKCRSIWCDGGELETIEMLLDDARKGTTLK